ncbi:D-alanine-D-alanine ligase, partial [Brevibacterium jeotgali]
RDYKWASNAQRSFAASVTAAGADLVIGHGSHMAQEIDIHNGRPLLHGIGNFVFNSNGRYGKIGVPPISIAAGLDLRADTTRLRLYPIHTDNRTNGFSGHPATEEEFADFYHTALLRTKDSAAFLKAVDPGQDDIGRYLSIDLDQRHRARVNRRHSGSGTSLTVWEEQPETIRFDRSLDSTAIMFERELAKRGASVDRLGTNFLIGESADGLAFATLSTSTNHTGVPGANAAKRKNVARTLLARAGVRVAEGQFFRSKDEFSEAVAFLERWGAVVVKPVDGNTGRGATVGVTDVEELRSAWGAAFAKTSTGVLVEEQFRGDDIRISVVAGVAYAANKRVPPHVMGDGTSTIRELINAKNDERYQNIHLHGKPITLTAFRLDRLEREGLTPLSVLPAGTTYIIDHKGNLATDAEPVDITDEIHPSYLRVAERAVRAFHSVDIAGVDFLGTDFSQPATADNHIVIEVNTMPDIGGHGSAIEGTPRNVVGPAVDSLLSSPRIGPFRPRIRKPDNPESPTSARLLAAEFAARGMTVDWITGTFFLATGDDSTHSVWGSCTGRTGQVAQLCSRRQAHAQALLQRAGIPTAEGRVYTVGEETAARTFAAGLGATTLRASDRALVDVDGTDSASFTVGWSQLEEPGQRFGISVSRRHEGTRLRLLVAHGRVITALTTGTAEPEDVLPHVDPSLRALAAAAAAAFPGLDLSEVTLTARYASRTAARGEVVVDQVLSGPDLVTHHVAAASRGEDIFQTIVDLHLGDESTAPELEFAWSEPTRQLSDHVRSAAEQATRHTRGFVRIFKRRLT